MRGKVQPRRVRTPTFINDVAAAVSEDGQLTIAEILRAFGLFFDTIHKTLHDDLWLSKKLARWVPKIAKKEEKVRMLESLVAAVFRHSPPFHYVGYLALADLFLFPLQMTTWLGPPGWDHHRHLRRQEGLVQQLYPQLGV